MYLIKYTLTVQFSIEDYATQLHNSNLLNIKVQIINFTKKYVKFGPKSQPTKEKEKLKEKKRKKTHYV